MDVANPTPLSQYGTGQSLLVPVAALWWVLVHLPVVFVRYYAIPAFRSLYFRVALKRGREQAIASPETRRMLGDYEKLQIAASDRILDARAMQKLDLLLDACGCREAVRKRKAEAHREGRSDFFHLSQEALSASAMEQLFGGILPGDFKPMLELAHGRELRCLSVTYHETDGDDPTVRVGSSLYNAHPFHVDGNPKFAKALIYLTDVDDAAGPFEMFSDSRFPLFDELVRLAYQEKHFRGRPRGPGARLRAHLPAWLRRPTHLWNDDVGDLQKRFPNAFHRITANKGAVVFFNGMNVHNGSRDQKKRREVLHFIFV